MILIAILGEQLKLLLAEQQYEQIEIDSVLYRDTKSGDFTGFYDFLRTAERHLIGIRYSFLEERNELVRYMKDKPYARVLSSNAFELYFFSQHSFSSEISDDQDFGENKLLRSFSGEYAITFGLTGLNPSEFAQLRSVAKVVKQHL